MTFIEIMCAWKKRDLITLLILFVVYLVVNFKIVTDKVHHIIHIRDHIIILCYFNKCNCKRSSVGWKLCMLDCIDHEAYMVNLRRTFAQAKIYLFFL